MSEEVIAELQRQLSAKDVLIADLGKQLNNKDMRIGGLQMQCSQQLSALRTEVDANGALRRELEETSKLRDCAKLRFMLETLEKVNRPSNFSEYQWRCDVLRREKWNMAVEEQIENDPWVKTFLECVSSCCRVKGSKEESKEIIRIIFNIPDDGIHQFFHSSPIREDLINSARIKCSIDCLLKLEPEILNFYQTAALSSPSTEASSSHSFTGPPAKRRNE